VVEPLSPHHRLHGVAIPLEVHELCGEWDLIAAGADRTATVVDANLSTPCIRNARSLLVTALALAYTGDSQGATSVEGRAEEVATEGYDFILAAPRARLALVRGEADLAARLVPPFDDQHIKTWFALPTATARLDALAAARYRDALEHEAPQFLRPGIYLEPFALRALGLVREDEDLITRAIERFDAMKLDWHADQTRALL
jgi:hypothetical protein